MRKLLLVLSLVFTAFGCAGPYTGPYMDYKHATRFNSCPLNGIENKREHAFFALQASLADVNWVIENIDTKSLMITAKACKKDNSLPADYLKRTDNGCASILFMVRENADIFAVIPKDKPVSSSMIKYYTLQDWMKALERVYSELHCFSDELLSDRVAGKINK
ncbi:MAG: hypothetical protein JXR91_01165 [Deltaproteobacteria bacterium]|nr:hypothetical protein [Deltaproteobacteria bacterium]